MSNKMLIDSSHPEETRVVVTKGNRLEEFDFESQHKKQIRGNIYLAKVTRVEPSLQAAFVDYGGNRHGFLAFSEIHPDYYQIPLADRQALIEEEAALADAEAADEDAEAEARSSKSNKGSGRKRRRRGRRDDRNKNGRSHGGRVPDAEPVAFDALLEAYEARIKEQASEDAEDVAIAAAVEGAATISEEVELDTSADDADAGDNNDNDDEDTSASDDVDVVADDDDAIEDTRPRRRSSRKQYKIQEVIKRRQVILVQVVKEERGNKGAALTTYMSLAGRYSVLMPNTARGGGISRKITVAADRKRLKDMVKGLDVPKGMGVILRTAGANRSREEVTRDYEYLMRLWDNVRDLTLSSSAPSLVYEEGNLIKRSIRDLYNKDISEIRVAGDQGYEQAREFMKMLMPSSEKAVKRWKDASPIFARTGMEAQLDKLMSPEVTLKSGGYIIINQTEALVSIDVNSGKSTRERSIEETAIATNLEAAEEVARQLRLRDLAGLIVIDFIDMEENRNNRAVEKKLKDCLKSDRARIQVGRISHFGLMEMSRQRMRASVLESTMQVCHHCSGTGLLRSAQSIALHVIRSIEDYLIRNSKNHIVVKTTAETAIYVLNEKRETLLDMEKRFGLNITIEIDGDVGAEMFAIERGEVSNLPKREVTHVTIDYDDEEDDNETAGAASHEDDEQQPKRRRRRRGKKNNQSEDDTAQASDDKSDDESSDENGEGRSKRRRRSRGRRGGRNRRNRYDRIPNAEVVGPMVEIAAAWDAEQTALKEAEDAAASKVDEAQIAETNGELKEAPIENVAETHSEAQPVEKTDVQVETAEPAIEEAAPKVEVEPVVETSAEEQSTRVRATAANIDLDVEPVIVTESAKPKAKKGGWWSR